MLKLDPVETAYIETLALIGKGNEIKKVHKLVSRKKYIISISDWSKHSPVIISKVKLIYDGINLALAKYQLGICC